MMDYYYGIENITKDPSGFFFKEGRRFGWRFRVKEPIVITKLMYFNAEESDEIARRKISIYKDLPDSFKFITDRYVESASNTWGFEDIQDGEVILSEGDYMLLAKVPNYESVYYVHSDSVEFGSEGIEFLTGVFENINDIGWLKTPNCYLVSFEYYLKNQIDNTQP